MAEQNLSYDDIKASRATEIESGVSQPDPDKLAREKTFAELNSLGLQANLAELESIGFTTVKGAISEDLVARARDAIVRVMERKTGATVDAGTNRESITLQTSTRSLAKISMASRLLTICCLKTRFSRKSR